MFLTHMVTFSFFDGATGAVGPVADEIPHIVGMMANMGTMMGRM